MSVERTELDHAIEALRDEVEVPLDGGAATEAAILRAVRTPPPWWKSGSVGPWGGVGLLAIAVGVAVLATHREDSARRDRASRTVSSATAFERASDAPIESAPIESAPIEGVQTEGAPIEEARIEGAPIAGEGAQPDRVEVTPPSSARRVGSTPRATSVPPRAPAVVSEPESASATSSATEDEPTAVTHTTGAPLSSDEQRTRFRDAHRLQYTAPPPVVLEAWDRFLRDVPTGAFADEARYYRALSLARLGRLDEAREALDAIAAGRHGERHRADAARVLRQLAR